MPLKKATLQDHYFTREGRAFLPTGAHWVPAKAALDWPIQWDPTEIEADFAKMRDLRFNTMRFDLFWAWFEPRPGSYNPEAFSSSTT
jgi:beta-galactosidase GanA